MLNLFFVAVSFFACLPRFATGRPSTVTPCDPAQAVCNSITTVASGNVAAINAIPLAKNSTASATVDGVGPFLLGPNEPGVRAAAQEFGLIMIKVQDLKCTNQGPLEGDATFIASYGIRATGTVLATANGHLHSSVDQACELVQVHGDFEFLPPTLA